MTIRELAEFIASKDYAGPTGEVSGVRISQLIHMMKEQAAMNKEYSGFARCTSSCR